MWSNHDRSGPSVHQTGGRSSEAKTFGGTIVNMKGKYWDYGGISREKIHERKSRSADE